MALYKDAGWLAGIAPFPHSEVLGFADCKPGRGQ
jgi:hypothetical protein